MVKIRKMIIASVYLSLYGTVMYFFNIHIYLSMILNIIAVIPGVIIAFGRDNIAKSLIMFLIASCLSGGFIFALCVKSDYGVIMNASLSNGTFYINISPLILLLGSISLYLSVWFLRRVYVRNYSRDRIIEKIQFQYKGCVYAVKCLVDTGCTLTEPLSDEPMMIIEKEIVDAEDGAEIIVNTVNGKSKMKLIFPENLTTENNSIHINKNTPIAVSNYKIGIKGVYNGIINPDAIINNGKEDELCKVF